MQARWLAASLTSLGGLLTVLSWAAPAAAQDAPWLPPTRPPTTSAPAPATAPTTATGDDHVDAMLYAGLGTASLGAATLVVFGIAQSRLRQLEDAPPFASYRALVPEGEDACRSADRGTELEGGGSAEEVRGICNEAATWEAMSFISLPTGLALLGVATYLVMSSESVSGDDAEEAAWRLSPRLGLRGGGLLVEGSF